MDDFRRADGGKVAVSLIGKDDSVGMHPFDPGSDGGRPTMGGSDHIHVEIIVGQHRTTDRSYPYCLVHHLELIEGFGHQTMDDAMMAARTIVCWHIRQRLGTAEYSFRHLTSLLRRARRT